MPKNIAVSSRSLLIALILIALVCAAPALAFAQGAAGDYEADRARAMQLFKDNNFTEALPLFEKLAAAKPSDRDVIEILGQLILTNSITMKDPAARKRERARARTYMVRAKEMGADDVLLNQMLASIPPDGGGDSTFSNRKEIDDAMREGEAAFAKGEMAKALAAYGRALKLDPNLYEAALFTGDVYYKQEDHAKAGEWFGRAISIEPDRETAYRYWADSLMMQGKTFEARDKYIESFIAEPYNRLARSGLIRWASQNNLRPAHPDIRIPGNVTTSPNGDVNIIMDESALKGKDDGSAAWLMYSLARARWMGGKNGPSEKFAKQFPTERTYRHSLAEEMDAFRLVLSVVDEQLKDKKIKQLDPSLAMLVRLKEAGLLEPYILLARADDGIIQDYASYRRTNKANLRRYVIDFILTNGGTQAPRTAANDPSQA